MCVAIRLASCVYVPVCAYAHMYELYVYTQEWFAGGWYMNYKLIDGYWSYVYVAKCINLCYVFIVSSSSIWFNRVDIFLIYLLCLYIFICSYMCMHMHVFAVMCMLMCSLFIIEPYSRFSSIIHLVRQL